MIDASSHISGKSKAFFVSPFQQTKRMQKIGLLSLLILIITMTMCLYFYIYWNGDGMEGQSCLIDSEQLHFNVTSPAILCHMNALHEKYEMYSPDQLCLWNPIRTHVCSHFQKEDRIKLSTSKAYNVVILRDSFTSTNAVMHAMNNNNDQWTFEDEAKVKLITKSFRNLIEDPKTYLGEIKSIVLEHSFQERETNDNVLILDFTYEDFTYQTLNRLYSHFDDIKKMATLLLPILQVSNTVLLISCFPKTDFERMTNEEREIDLLKEYLLVKYLVHDHHIVHFPKKSSKTMLEDYIALAKEFSLVHDRNSEALTNKCSSLLNTRKYSQDCMPLPFHRMKFLVTGLGGAGTHEITNTLQSMQINALHESIPLMHANAESLDVSVCWFYAVNDVFSGIEYPHHAKLQGSLAQHGFLNPRFQTIIHVIRNPLQHISSFTSHLTQSYQFIVSSMASDNLLGKDILKKAFLGTQTCARGKACKLLMAMVAWVLWNYHVSTQADYTFRIDSDYEEREMYDLFSKFAQTQNSPKTLLNGKRAIGSIAHKHHQEYSYRDLFVEDAVVFRIIQKMATKYKYSVPEI